MSALSSPCTRELYLESNTLAVSTPVAKRSARAFSVLKASTSGSTVHDGIVALRQDTVLLLTGQGVHFQGTTFTGAALRTSVVLHEQICDTHSDTVTYDYRLSLLGHRLSQCPPKPAPYHDPQVTLKKFLF